MSNVQLNQMSNNFKITEGYSHQVSTLRFQEALHAGNSGGTDDNSGSDGDGRNKHDAAFEERRPPKTGNLHNLPAGVLSLFRESLEQAFSEDAMQTGLVEQLLNVVGNCLQAGKSLKGNGWRFSMRLQPNILPMTSLEMSYLHTVFKVILRTSDEDAYRSITNALPRLNITLANKSLGDKCATVSLVNAKDLP